jgi:HD-GYP domain-containing protein (c-di-GMP phosphodiesterase class II)
VQSFALENLNFDVPLIRINSGEIYKEEALAIERELEFLVAGKYSLFKVMKSIPPVKRPTVWHSNSVRHQAVEIGNELKFTPEQISLLKLSALYHDFGKFLKEYDWLFQTKGALTEKERKHIDMHAYASATLVGMFWQRYIPEAWMVLPVVLTIAMHHTFYNVSEEKFRQLTLEPQIQQLANTLKVPESERELELKDFPLEAGRVLKVADFYVANTERRSYKETWSPIKTLRELMKGAGSEFDPAAVTALLKIKARLFHKVIES